MHKELIENIAKLRTSISFLGEKTNWWNSNFFDKSSSDILNYVFPKSKNVNLNQAVEIVRHKIDHEVGANYYHLFRLKIKYEELIKKEIENLDLSYIQNEQGALEILNRLSDGMEITKSPGPKNIGNIESIDDSLIQAFAAEYYSAFSNNYIVHPYLN